MGPESTTQAQIDPDAPDETGPEVTDVDSPNYVEPSEEVTAIVDPLAPTSDATVSTPVESAETDSTAVVTNSEAVADSSTETSDSTLTHGDTEEI